PAAALLPERLGVDVLRADPRVADHHVAYGPQPPHLVIAEVRPRLLLPQQPRLEALLHRLAVGPELLVHPQLVADQGDQIRNAGLPARLLHRSAQVLVVGPQQLRCPSVLRALDLPGELLERGIRLTRRNRPRAVQGDTDRGDAVPLVLQQLLPAVDLLPRPLLSGHLDHLVDADPGGLVEDVILVPADLQDEPAELRVPGQRGDRVLDQPPGGRPAFLLFHLLLVIRVGGPHDAARDLE